MKKAVVSAVIATDFVRDIMHPFLKMDGWDYHLFVNDIAAAHMRPPAGWIVHVIPTVGTMGAHTAKHVKWMTHAYLPDYDIVAWVDAHITPNKAKQQELEDLCLKLQESNAPPFALLRHPMCKSAAADISSCVIGRKCSREKADAALNFLRTEQFPDTYGDFWSCMVVRNNKNPAFHAYGETMMNLILNIAHRDQFWIGYVLWKLGMSMPECFDPSLFVTSGYAVDHSYA